MKRSEQRGWTGRPGPGRPANRRAASRSGQALVELAAALVVVVVLVAALIQIGRLSQAHLQALNDARERAGSFAASRTGGSDPPDPVLIANWQAGPDRRAYSRDDTYTRASAGALRIAIAEPARPADLSRYVAANPLTRMYAGDPLDTFGLVHGAAASRPVPLLPAARHLFYDAESITMEADVWMVRLEDVY
jgi:hypothetical protein